MGDTWGEDVKNAALFESSCTTLRKSEYDHWCGASDTKMFFVPPATPEAHPTESGCWVRTPTGCPNQEYNAGTWTQDTWGEMHANAAYDQHACEATRKSQYNEWCGASDSETYWVAPVPGADPTEPGCYVLTPSGCPNQASFNAEGWTQDDWGEEHVNAANDQSACINTRKSQYNDWCGTADTQMFWVAPPEPTAPGCYVKTPSGCPSQSYNAYSWTQDTWGEEHRNAGAFESQCMDTRKSEYNSWCGASDTVMKFIPPATPEPDPTSPGCWVRTPNACPNQAGFNARTWTRDSWGESHSGA